MTDNSNLWYLKSKGIWAGVLLMLYSIAEWYLTGNFDPTKFLTGLGIVGIRHGIEKASK
jgi:hypothetical protein